MRHPQGHIERKSDVEHQILREAWSFSEENWQIYPVYGVDTYPFVDSTLRMIVSARVAALWSFSYIMASAAATVPSCYLSEYALGNLSTLWLPHI
jgi:hypothetical protein